MMNAEQRSQLALVLSALRRDFYHPLGSLELTGFRAEKSLTPEQAAACERQPMPEGTPFLNAWEYGWLFADFTLDASAKGERIVLSLNPGGESTLFLNGRAFGTRRAEWVQIEHHNIVDQTIVRCAEGGERFSLMMEVYGGTPLPHAPNGRCATGPVFPDEGVLMDNPPPAVIGRNTYGVWNEEAYQLWLDLSMLLDVCDTQDADSFFREKIGHDLGALLNSLDMEQPLSARRAAYVRAREQIAPLMQAKNGTFAPAMAAIGNSHLDVAWLWPTAETARKTVRTFAQQLRHLEEYPEALFLQSQCVLYEMCREQNPQLFEDIRKAIRGGQWIADGSMWVEPDTNLPNGESLVRQFLYGMRYFSDVLGVKAHIAWLPDTFGYSAAMPQILAGFGLDGLTTQKIFWTYNDAEKFPHHAFIWKGLDGSEIPSYLHMPYESFVDVKTLVKRWHDRVEQDGSGDFFLPYGYGDGGGGPTRDDLEQLRREADLQGVPKMRHETPADFFARRDKASLPVYRGELYFQCHRGTYTSQAAVKRGNRRCESALHALELWCAATAMRGAADYPAAEIERLWKLTLFNQFHDILPGSAIAQVYEEAKARHAGVLADAAALTDKALSSLCAGEGVTLFHAQSAARTQLVELDARFLGGAATYEGENIPCMPYKGGALAKVQLPAMGHVSLRPHSCAQAAPAVTAKAIDGGWALENERLCVTLNARGEVTSVLDRKTGMQRLGGVSNRMRFLRDVPRAFDAWDIDSQIFDREFAPELSVSAQIDTQEGLRAAVRFTIKALDSTITQVISLDSGAMRVDFDTHVSWHERHKLLKVAFDTGIDAPEAANQIQFGHIMRPTHRSRALDADRFEVCNHAYTALFDATHGAAMLNDCKYGVSMDKSEISLTLLRGATHPDPAADQGEHDFRYAFFFWDGALDRSGLVYEAGALNHPVLRADGFMPAASLFSCADEGVVVDTVKLAEDGSGDCIVRLYESMNGRRKTTLRLPQGIARASLCSLAEDPICEIPVCGGGVELTLRPFEIATIRLHGSK